MKLCQKEGVTYRELQPKSMGTLTRNETASGSNLRLKLLKTWTVPPKIKPGRKPKVNNSNPNEASDEDDDIDTNGKRRRQNREAQRAYRERQAKRFSELEDEKALLEQKIVKIKQELVSVEAGYRVKLAEMERQNGILLNRIRILESNAKIHNVESQQANTTLISIRRKKVPNTLVNLPVFKRLTDSSESEISAARSNSCRIDGPGDEGCGFCFNGSTCVCKQNGAF
ncbi:HDL020Cp [Eremothecium sinecaudum]|uniref:HDL020Cp n=1 Tax=Eremothecium sinecaudum TaxID=45286 RepID=A0A0X8HSN8_9SACH|nr:HDL020Cp [Eremothecium sinecaudum]AMD20724.1 HDL020Cp [Eremothecium sinecaudum]